MLIIIGYCFYVVPVRINRRHNAFVSMNIYVEKLNKVKFFPFLYFCHQQVYDDVIEEEDPTGTWIHLM